MHLYSYITSHCKVSKMIINIPILNIRQNKIYYFHDYYILINYDDQFIFIKL